MIPFSTYSGERKLVHINSLFLDPNNYRFIDNKNYTKVSVDNIENVDIQGKTSFFIIEEKRNGIKDLINSFFEIGYLDIDTIIVSEFAENKFLIIDGNRRVATLKELYEDFNNGKEIGNLNSSIFDKIPVLLFPKIELKDVALLMGLKHINGIKKWAKLNQATLIFDLKKIHNWEEEQLTNLLGGDKLGVRKSLKTINLISDFKNSECGEKFETEMYSIFEEIISSKPIKTWLNWDENTNKPQNADNTEKLFNWLIDTENEKKIIEKSKDVRDLAKIIINEVAIKRLEETHSLMDAYLVSDQVGIDKFYNTLEIIEKQIDEASKFSEYAQADSKILIQKLLNKLQSLTRNEIVFTKNKDRQTFINQYNTGFNEIKINRFKRFENITIKNLSRINVFAGDNNSGKSSILELIYLLAKLNDLNAFFEVFRRRGKFNDKLSADWLKKEFNAEYDIIANFDGKELKYNAFPLKETTDINDTYYLFSIEQKCEFAGEQLFSKAQIFENETKLDANKIRWICNASLSSPFSTHNSDDIVYCHEKSNEMNIYETIIQFIQNHIDKKIENIIFVGETNRFLVKHTDFDEPVDLTRFGDGLQRIFNISLQIAVSANGIMCIDELENAIHYTLLTKFVDFLQKLAEKFNVQIFITSHSKECIDAIFDESLDLNNISGYNLSLSDNQIVINHEQGKYFSTLIKNFDADLR